MRRLVNGNSNLITPPNTTILYDGSRIKPNMNNLKANFIMKQDLIWGSKLKNDSDTIGYIIFESSTNDGGDGDILCFFEGGTGMCDFDGI
jgi:hypothetical protein